MVGQRRGVDVREKLDDVRDAALQGPFFARAVPQFLHLSEGEDDPGIAAEQPHHVQIVIAVVVEGFIVEGANVITLHRGFADQLPVGIVHKGDGVEDRLLLPQQVRQVRQRAIR